MNETLIEKLGPKTVKRSNVKYKGGQMIPCNQCGYAFKSTSSLNNHKTYEHALSFSSSRKSLEPRNSTRNNSFTGSLMIEYLTNAYSSSDYKSKKKYLLIKHIDEHIGPKSVHIDSNTQAEQIDQGRDHSKMDYSNQIDDSIESAIEESDEKEETMGDERDDHSKGENIIEIDDSKDADEEEIGGKEEMLEKRGEMVEKIELLYSCEKCDFDSDNCNDVREHMNINIHNVHNQNRTLEDSKEEILIDDMLCDFCEFRTNDSLKLEEHSETSHGSIKCQRCEYKAVDKEIMK